MSATITGGTAGLDFATDLITRLNDSWIPANVKKPENIVKQWKYKVDGHGTNRYSTIILSLTSENPQIFSLLQGDSTDWTKFEYEWLHEVSVDLDIKTSESEEHVLKLVNEVVRILKGSIVPMINNRQYVQLMIEGIMPLNEEYRNLYRYLVSLGVLRLNP